MTKQNIVDEIDIDGLDDVESTTVGIVEKQWDYPGIGYNVRDGQLYLDSEKVDEIELTVFAAARESTRYAIHGVLWEVEGKKLTLAATDGRRLALGHGALLGEGAASPSHAIVPPKALSLFTRLPAEEGAVSPGRGHCRLATPSSPGTPQPEPEVA